MATKTPTKDLAAEAPAQVTERLAVLQATTPVVVERDETGLQMFTGQHAYLIGQQIAQNASPAEIQLFLMQARSLDLDPFTGQIWLVPRKDQNGRNVHKSEIGIAGFLFVAERSGQHGGFTPTEWLDAAGQWHDVWIADQNPVAARVGVRRKDWDEPSISVGTWKEFAVYITKDGKRVPGPMWRSMPAHMLEKCVTVKGLRRAHPDLAGVLLPGERMAGGYDEESAPAAIKAAGTTSIDPNVAEIWQEFMAITPTLTKPKKFKAHILALLADEHGHEIDKLIASNLTAETAAVVRDEAAAWNDRPFDEEE